MAGRLFKWTGNTWATRKKKKKKRKQSKTKTKQSISRQSNPFVGAMISSSPVPSIASLPRCVHVLASRCLSAIGRPWSANRAPSLVAGRVFHQSGSVFASNRRSDRQLGGLFDRPGGPMVRLGPPANYIDRRSLIDHFRGGEKYVEPRTWSDWPWTVACVSPGGFFRFFLFDSILIVRVDFSLKTSIPPLVAVKNKQTKKQQQPHVQSNE